MEVDMCRWLAYSGSPVLLGDLLYKPKNSLVMQSKHSRLGVETTNGDGFGRAEARRAAVARGGGLIERIGREHDVKYPIQMTVATTDGNVTWAFRFSSEGRSRSLFHSTDVSVLRSQYPDNPLLHSLSDDARLVVSEPLGDLHGAWQEVPDSSCLIVEGGNQELRPFT